MKSILDYFNLNSRYQDAVIRWSQRLDPEQIIAAGGSEDEINRRPYSIVHQVLMFCATFVGVFFQKGVSQYINDQPMVFSIPTIFELAIYGAISIALMPFVYARFAKIPVTLIIVQLGWALLYGFFSRAVLVAAKEIVIAAVKLIK